MLTLLHILDLAVVREAEIEFGPGMTLLTGETGAGKSILVDALGLVLGDRADPRLIRADSERAEISAEFDLAAVPAARDYLNEQELTDGDHCVVRRVLVRDGRARAYVNGRPVSQAMLEGLAGHLVDIHGQHAHQSLLRAHHQRRLLDIYGELVPLTEATAEAHRRMKAVERELDRLRTAEHDRESRLELLRFQLDELDELDLRDGELDALDAALARLGNADALRETDARMIELLFEQDDSVRDRLGAAVAALGPFRSTDPRLGEIAELLESARIQIEEAATGLRQHLELVESEPAELARVERRLEKIHDLARKHRIAPERLIEHRTAIAAELDGIEAADSREQTLSGELATLEARYRELAAKLSDGRAAAAERLARRVNASFVELGMSGGRFEIALQPLDPAKAGAHGLEAVEYRVSANAGMPLQPLAAVASGGELSRIGLAIQVATAECGEIPTLIFDEVDVGIGGAVAEVVGRLLRELGRTRQVLCITHLPQVAAQGHHHLRVVKEQQAETTETRILRLSGEARVDEVARMLGGLEVSVQATAHAREMLARAAAG